MENHWIGISIFLLVFLNLGCQKTQEKLPEETQVGSFTIGFKVNGKVYQTSGKGRMGLVSFGHVDYQTELIDSSIYVSAVRSVGETAFTLRFRIKYTNGLGTYLLKTNSYKGKIILGTSGTGPEHIYETSDVHIGQVNINYFNGQLSPSPPPNILAGTFEMKAVNQFGRTISITDGRFDIGD